MNPNDIPPQNQEGQPQPRPQQERLAPFPFPFWSELFPQIQMIMTPLEAHSMEQRQDPENGANQIDPGSLSTVSVDAASLSNQVTRENSFPTESFHNPTPINPMNSSEVPLDDLREQEHQSGSGGTSTDTLSSQPIYFQMSQFQMPPLPFLIPSPQDSETSPLGSSIMAVTFILSPSDIERFMSATAAAMNPAHFSLQGQPPASKEALKNQVRSCPGQSEHSCGICLDNFQESEKMTYMTCKHFFHSGCLDTWLKQSNTCPTCRYEILTDNEDYNRGVRERMSQRKMGGLELAFDDYAHEKKKSLDTDFDADKLSPPPKRSRSRTVSTSSSPIELTEDSPGEN